MNTALRLLWKEWREQRIALALTFLLVAFAFGGSGLLLARDPFRDGLVLACAVGASVLAALLTFGGELVAGEDARSLRFLERLPSGLRGAFAAKSALFLVAVPAAALFGLTVALGTSELRSGEVARTSLDVLTSFDVLAPSAVIVLWTFAVSSWVPRGALALPAAALVLAGLAWPAWLVFVGSPWFQPLEHERHAFLALGAAGALAAGAWSCCSGRRFARGASSAAWRGLVLGALFFTPSWCWAGIRYHASRTIDPFAEDFRIAHCWIGVDGRFAFLHGSREPRFVSGDRHDSSPIWPLAVELATGDCFELGGPGDTLHPEALRSAKQAANDTDHAAPVGVLLVQAADGRTRRRIDGRTALVLPPLAEPHARGMAEFPELPEGWERSSWAGLGCRVQREGARGLKREAYYDPSRGRVFTLRELFGADELPSGHWILVREGDWLVCDSIGEAHWALDPETGAWRELEDLAGATHVGPLLRDGRALVLRDGRLSLFDLERGSLAALELADASAGDEDWMLFARNARVTLAPLDWSEPVLLCVGAAGWSGLVRLDLGDLSLHRSASYNGHLAGVLADGSILAVEQSRRLVRLRFDSQEREILFPREP